MMSSFPASTKGIEESRMKTARRKKWRRRGGPRGFMPSSDGRLMWPATKCRRSSEKARGRLPWARVANVQMRTCDGGPFGLLRTTAVVQHTTTPSCWRIVRGDGFSIVADGQSVVFVSQLQGEKDSCRFCFAGLKFI